MEFSLSKPKSKRWCSHPRLPPLPIQLEDFPPENPAQRVFSGQLHGSAAVLVSHSGDKHYLYNRGFFGTCVLPISHPDASEHTSKLTSKRNAWSDIMSLGKAL